MLILTRRIDEALLIGQDIEIVPLEIDGNQVRLGISAPKDMKILREELLPERAPQDAA